MLFRDSDLLVPLDPPFSERKAWNRREASQLPNTYIGQLKLLSGEIALLALGLSTEDLANSVIVYAGAAGGHHIPALAELIPDTTFYLYDPAPFAIESTDQLIIVNGMFTDETANEWAQYEDGRVIFICDIRTSGDTAEEHESEVHANMQMQARWIEIMRPNLVAFFLKFRIPYTIIEADIPFKYLGGTLLYQPYAKPDSMELRLLGKGSEPSTVYDSKTLEQTVFYHNSVMRPNLDLYLNIFTGTSTSYSDPQFDNGYDCTFFLYSIMRFLQIHEKDKVTEATVLKIAQRMLSITSQGKWTLAQRKSARRVIAQRPRR